MPSLQNLTLDGDTSIFLFDSFFATHGHSLRFLNIVPDSCIPLDIPWSSKGIQALLDQCPLLEHIAVPPLKSETVSYLFHSTVECIDMWVTESHMWHIYDKLELGWIDMLNLLTGFPKRRGFRAMDGLFRRCSEFVNMIPPVVAQDFEPFDLVVPGVHVRHECCHIYKMDMEYVVDHDVDDDASDTSDQTYSFSGSSSSSSSSSSLSYESLADEQS